MKPGTKQYQDAMDTFIDRPESRKIVVRRSELELMTTCPAQYRLLKQGKGVDCSELTEVGEAVHQAIALATLEYVESDHGMPPNELLEEAEVLLRGVRPDIQPKALAAGRRALWSWARYVSQLPQRTIIAFDGGDKALHPEDKSKSRTGQLSWEVVGVGIDDYIVTAELDLLHSTRSPEVLVDVDFKSGWKSWNYEDVFDAFQFSVHAFLVFKNYPTVQFLDCKLWSTRSNTLTPTTRFSRSDLPAIEARIRNALGHFDQYAKDPNPPAWAYPEKCAMCSCALACPASMSEVSSIAAGPIEAVKRYIALGEALKAQKEALKAYVTITGNDIVSEEEGLAFGRDKPSAERWSADPVYKISGAKKTEPKKETKRGRSRKANP